MTQAVLPRFRARRSGTIVNITSAVTLQPMPLLAVYTASKAAVNAFTESLALELRPFNIRVGLILPGRAPQTRFGENARRTMGQLPESYAPLGQQILDSIEDNASVTQAVDVAQAVWRMVKDPQAPSRLPAGEDAWRWRRLFIVANNRVSLCRWQGSMTFRLEAQKACVFRSRCSRLMLRGNDTKRDWCV